MNIILYERDLCINSIVKKFEEKWPNSSTIHINSVKDFILGRPILTDGYLVIVKCVGKNCKNLIEKFATNDGSDVILFVSPNINEVIVKYFKDLHLSYQIIDNTVVEEKELINYVINELNIGVKLADLIVKRCRNWEPRVINAVEMLKSCSISRAIVLRYLKDYNQPTYFDVYRLIVEGVGDKDKVVAFLYDHRHNVSSLIRYIHKQLKRDIRMYSDVINGVLSSDNILEYSEQEGFGYKTVVSLLSKYKRVSFERIVDIYLHLQIDKCDVYDVMAMVSGD